MLQGLGEAHNADVLLEPPVQSPFYSHSRLLFECRDYSRRVGLNTLRSALDCRQEFLSNMVVYCAANDRPEIRMISIAESQLREARVRLREARIEEGKSNEGRHRDGFL